MWLGLPVLPVRESACTVRYYSGGEAVDDTNRCGADGAKGVARRQSLVTFLLGNGVSASG